MKGYVLLHGCLLAPFRSEMYNEYVEGSLRQRKRRAHKGPTLQVPCSSFWIAQDFVAGTDRDSEEL